jgi:hypothetical protein
VEGAIVNVQGFIVVEYVEGAEAFFADRPPSGRVSPAALPAFEGFDLVEL